MGYSERGMEYQLADHSSASSLDVTIAERASPVR
jgi:hypothetical protein